MNASRQYSNMLESNIVSARESQFVRKENQAGALVRFGSTQEVKVKAWEVDDS